MKDVDHRDEGERNGNVAGDTNQCERTLPRNRVVRVESNPAISALDSESDSARIPRTLLSSAHSARRPREPLRNADELLTSAVAPFSGDCRFGTFVRFHRRKALSEVRRTVLSKKT